MIRQLAISVGVLVAIAAGVWALVARHRKGEAEPMRAALRAEIESGSCAGLRRAQVFGRRLVLTDSSDASARAAVALAGATLAVECAEPLTADAGEFGADDGAGSGRDERGAADAVAAHVLLLIAAGRPADAARDAEAAIGAVPGMPQPLFALGRARARAGDLVGASHALEAAMVAGPAFLLARVAWAEVRLDLGDAATAAEALRAIPNPDLRARLLADEIARARGGGPPLSGSRAASLDAACDDSRVGSALESAACALRDATRARLAGDRVRARGCALAAAGRVPPDPRLLGEVAQLLAELGAVDRAAALVARAQQLATPDVPAIAWAALGVVLGRGRAPARPVAPPPPAPEGALLEVRVALATGGIGALAAALALESPGARTTGDPDRDQLARLAAIETGTGVRGGDGRAGVRADGATVEGAGGGAEAAASADAARRDDPVSAYVAGLRARLAGDLPSAAEHLSHGLAGHGDACRAAGEYVAVLRGLKRRAAPEDFVELRAENAACVNLPGEKSPRGSPTLTRSPPPTRSPPTAPRPPPPTTMPTE